jgi:hypothetical protein
MNYQLNKHRNHRIKIGLGMMILILILSACSFSSIFNRHNNNQISATPTLQSNEESEKTDNEFVDFEGNSSGQTVETITIFRMDGTEEKVPLLYTSSTDLLEAKIASGEWTEGEGLIILLKLFTGEINIDEVPGSELVLEFSGTGAVRWGQDFIADNNNDPELKAEIERLLSKLFPSEEILDLISKPSGRTSNIGVGKTAMLDIQASSSCQDLASNGFQSEFFDGGDCYLYDEANINGFSYRVYYPSSWQGDEEKENLVDVAFTGLTESVVVFFDYGDMEDINMMFSLLPDLNSPETLAFQTYAPKGTTCPLTLLPSSSVGSIDVFKQTIAHEVFHCFQDWNFTTVPYSQHKWWGEGSAEYFSNVVYPSTNDEHRFLDQFDLRSRNQSLQKMSYENFIFFQHVANTYGNQQTIELLRSIGNASGSTSALASFPDMSDTFFDFVFKYMSTGINDTGGTMIIQQPIAVTAINPINDEGEETFSTHAFVATRYGMKYEKEKRFLQSPKPADNIKYSTVKNKDRRDPTKWSDLPPELRSTCDEDLMYAMAVTTTDTGGSVDFIADIEKVEKAECDPCLLGVWEVDNTSFEEYIKRLLDSQGGLEGFPPGMELLLEIEGHYYVEFKEDREMLTRRDNFSILSGAVGFPGLITIIDSQGNGEYSTTDGKRLSLYNLVDYVNLVEAYIEDMPINVNMTTGASTYSMFGASASGPGYENDSGQDNVTSDYICTEENLTINDPEFGELLYNRVEKIIPTPVPTMSP